MRITEQLVVLGHDVVFCATDVGRDVCAHELGFVLPTEDAPTAAGALAGFLELGATDDRLRVAFPGDLFDPLASGSHPLDAVIVAPASMGFCASVAAGTANDLPQRACDVALKERRPLVVVPRETPLSLAEAINAAVGGELLQHALPYLVHLRTLSALTEAGAIVVPAMPAFYQRPETIDDLISFIAGKVFDVLGIEHDLFTRWGSR